jgi:hypothetical protein
MTEKWKEQKWAEDIWYSGKLTRRRIVGWGGGAIGAMMLVPAPWRAAFGAEKAYKIGSEQPLSGAGAAGGCTMTCSRLACADACSRNAASRAGSSANANPAARATDAGFVSTGRRHSQRTFACGSGFADVGAGLIGDHNT